MKSRLSYMLMVASVAFASMGANAAVEWTWILGSSTSPQPQPVGIDLPGTSTVMGYSAANDTSQLVATGSVGQPDMTWYSGSGYGICSASPGDPTCTSPNHAVDNNVAKESVVLSFAKAVTLSWLDIGWNGGYDSDLSVLAYTGTGAPVFGASINNSNLLSNGWSLVGQYANVVVSTSLTTAPSLNLGTGISSSYWMIAAYNSKFGTSCSSTATGACSDSNDYVKIYAVAGNTTNPPPPGRVSEPASMLLLTTAMLGIAGLRRRESVK
jgi:hypothetical protein